MFIAGVVMHYMYMCNVIVYMYLWLLTHVAGLLLLLVLLLFFVLAFCSIPEVIVVVDEFVFVVATVISNSLLICSLLHHAFIAIINAIQDIFFKPCRASNEVLIKTHFF